MTRFLACLFLLAAVAHADWPTFGGDPQRTGWARGAWRKQFSAAGTPGRAPDTLFPYALNATPVLQTGRTKTMYAISSDGNLHALNAVNGEDRISPKQFVSAFSKNWSLNLSGDVISSFTHFGGIALSNGRIFVTSYDGTVYAFGIKNEER